MVPEGWHSTKLGDRFTSRREKGIAGLLTLSVTLNDGLVLRDSLDRKTDTNLSAQQHLLVRQGDIAYNMMRMWQGASGLAEFDALVSPAYIVLRPKKAIDSLFASYLLKSARTKYLLWAYSYGLTKDRLRLYFRDFSLIPVELPPIEEQRRIGMVLWTWDRAIETVDSLIENSEAQKRALMQRLLTGTERSPQFKNQPWKFVPLRHLCTVRRGASPRPIQDPQWFAAEGRGWVRISDVTGSQTEFLQRTDQYLSALGVQKSVPVDPGELIMSICATIGVPKIVGIPVCIHDGFVVFREISDYLDKSFLYYLLEFYTQRLANSGQPGTQKNLNTTIVGNIQVPTFPIEEQRAIAAVLGAADRAIRLQQTSREQLMRQKKALMQQLLTGKKRLKMSDDAPPLSATG